MVKQKTMNNYICSFCNHEYRLKYNYDRHVILCRFSNKSMKEVEDQMDEFDTMPSQKDMFVLLKDLAYRVSKLELENKTLKKFANRERKKIDIIDWLNTTSGWKPKQGFRDWVTSFPLLDYLNCIFENDLVYGICYCFENAIREQGETPMAIFSQKNNIFYIYDKPANDIDACWFILSNDCFNEWIDYIARRFLILFRQWFDKQCEENPKHINELNDKKAILYQKLLGGKITDETRNNRVKSSLCAKMKVNAKSILDYYEPI